MIFYVGTAVLLWMMSFRSALGGVGTGFGILFGTLIFWAISAFRFETGFDWMIYEGYFNAVASSDFLVIPTEVVSMEPLYYLLNYVVSTLGDFQFFLFVIGTVNAVCAIYFFYKLGIRVVFGLAFVFCWVYLPLELGTIRQSLAVSFMLVSIVSLSRGKTVSAFVFFLIAFGFQYSALIYSVVFFRRFSTNALRFAYPILLCSLAFYLLVPSGAGQGLLAFGASLNIPFVSEKLAVYADFGGSPKSLAGYGFMILNCILLAYARKKLDYRSEHQRIMMVILLMLIVAQAFLSDFALIWNRIHYIAAFCQAVLIYHIICCHKQIGRLAIYSGAACISVLSIFMFLRTEASVPFIPYQSYIYSELTGDPGDGRYRSIMYYKIFEDSKPAQQ